MNSETSLHLMEFIIRCIMMYNTAPSAIGGMLCDRTVQ